MVITGVGLRREDSKVVKGQQTTSRVMAMFYVLTWSNQKDVQFVIILYSVRVYFLPFGYVIHFIIFNKGNGQYNEN